MKPITKIALIISGYLVALLAAWAAVVLNARLSGTSNNGPSAGMAAFSDALLFVLVFGAIALIPTGASIYLLWARGTQRHRSPDTTTPSARE